MVFLRSRYTREGSGLPAPQTGTARFFFLLTSHFWKLIILNLLVLLFSIPVVTIPAAVCAAFRVCILLIRNGNVFLWADYREEIQRSFLKSLPAGIAAGVLLSAGYFFMSLGAGNASLPGWSLLFWTAGISLTYFGVTWGSYVLALLAITDQKLSVVMKNALLLIIIRPGHALAVFLAVFALVFGTAVFAPASLILIIAAALSLTVFILSWIIYGLAKDHILQ